ncbi:alpha-galactosidase [Aliiglaciecola sp. 3_MG-2023]|uniref:alpha-galactosidase n=1 Tax=Aliiglaciecola sp. 3_MG-2023 TaxID=3062644 RepID=UPI0026E190D4|nr:alpha-galactosidase [Aliiglaciecola sp. 3_MG-2023]MDO6692816.1 alpha-galactosidase [Aliiglaciecola sp. 3_MG-2023]
MSQLPNVIQLNSEQTSLIIDCEGKTPSVLYWGKSLSAASSVSMLRSLATRQEVKCAVVVEAPISLSPLSGEGFTGAPGIEISNDNSAWSLGGALISIKQQNAQSVEFVCVDNVRQIEITHKLHLDKQTNVLTASTAITNRTTAPLNVTWCAAPTIPLADNINKILSFEGRWSNEFLLNKVDLFLGSFLRENRKGKTSHDNFPGVVLYDEKTDEHNGDCYGFHLGWSGNHRTRVEHLPEGRNYVQLGELLMPGELILQANESYQSPNLYASFSDKGISGLSQNYHHFVRQNLIRPEVKNKPRPVHFNTWEGLYFDHDIETLKNLAKQVSELGIERFVLDDGWFKGRRGDAAGLGDWYVDKDIYPEGLGPLIEYVNSLGLEFGLWFEPEMVNPDSDLFRNHPDWVLATEGNEQLEFRNQLVLDLTNKEVTDYLFKVIDDILSEHPQIKYIKWDNNRDYNHPGNHLGKPAIHLQTLAFYQLIDNLKTKHPQVEIESCASGGGRIDYGVLSRTDRVWTSDSNDALDRLSIQRGCSIFFPSEIMGAHVGPRDCHITGRHISIEMRAAVAFFGHMGIEMDPRELTSEEKQALSEIISLHKKHRCLIHSGNLVRLNENPFSVDFGIVSEDRNHALFAYNSVNEVNRTNPGKYRFVGLAIDKVYQLNLIWPTDLKEYSPSVLRQIEGQVFTGEVLQQFGMQLPALFPQTSLIFELKAV